MPRKENRIPLETRKHQVRRAHERKQERLLYFGLAGLAALILLVLGIGYYQENIALLNNPIASVNGVPITVRDYQTRLRYEGVSVLSALSSTSKNLEQMSGDPSTAFLRNYLLQQQAQSANQLVTLPRAIYERMIDDEIVRQEAARLKLSVSADQVDEEIEKSFLYQRATPTPTAGPSPTATLTGTPTRVPTATNTPTRTPSPTGIITPTTPTLTPTLGPTETPFPTSTPISFESYQDQKKKFIEGLNKSAQLAESDFRKIIEINILRRHLQDELAKQAPTTADQFQSRHILLKTLDDAVKVKERLDKGEDFAKLAQELSEDKTSGEQGGDLGWSLRGQFIPEFENAALALKVNEISQPITSTFGVHIIQLTGREQNRPLDDAQLQQKRGGALVDWLTLTRLAAKIERAYDDRYVPVEIKRAIENVLKSQQR